MFRRPHCVALAIALVLPLAAWAQGPSLLIRADRPLHPASPYWAGACLEDVNHEVYGGLYSQMIFGESFQEPAPASAIAGFKAVGGDWRAMNGVALVHATDGPKLVSDHPPFRDGTTSVELRFENRQGGNGGLILRVDDPRVGADAFTGYEIALEPSRQNLLLARHRRNFEPIKEIPCPVAVGRWIPLEVRLTGTTVEILVDGKSIIRHDDGAIALGPGKVALRAWQREASYRNLRVKTGNALKELPFVAEKPPDEVSGMWRPAQRGSAAGAHALVATDPFVGKQAQQLRFDSGAGEWGVENQGLNRQGMSFLKGRDYVGFAWVRAEKPVEVVAALESLDGALRHAEAALAVAPGGWRKLSFSLTPSDDERAGRFTLALKKPGAVVLGHAFLQPGEWGRFKGLPVRRDVAEGLIGQGVKALRYGGLMANAPEYRWKKMIGPRDRRPPYAGYWYPHSTNGFGILDFLDFCDAAGFLAIPDFNMDESPHDMADFVEYANGPATSKWGARRAADGRPQPYKLRHVQLGNEEKVDEAYFRKFKPLAEAIWARDAGIVVVVGDFAYGAAIRDPFRFQGAASGVTTLAPHREMLKLAKKHDAEIWFDVHVGTEGPLPEMGGTFSFVDALAKLAAGARHKVAIFEFNSNIHSHRRALANAAAILHVARDGRIPVALSANCLQVDKQNDNGWNQGLLFLNPSKVWLQPPGYVTQMFAKHRLPTVVSCEMNNAPPGFIAAAMRSEDGKTLQLAAVNPGDEPIDAAIKVEGFDLRDVVDRVSQLAAPLDAVNSALKPDAVAPVQSEPRLKDQGETRRIFAPRSFTIIRWERFAARAN